jgi:hypothetical protein
MPPQGEGGSRCRHALSVVHGEPEFVDRARAALVLTGYELATFTDLMVALKTLEAAQHSELLIARVRFPPGRGNGIRSP